MNNPSNSHNFNDFTVFGIGLYSCSPIMEYLFHRIKPSLVKYSHELEWFSLSRIEKVLKRLDSIEENNNDPNQNNEMEDSVEDESDRDSEDEYSNDTEDVSDAESEDEYGNDTEDVSDAESEDEYGNDTEEVSDAESEDESGKDMEDMSDEESELESDKDTKDESHEDAEGVPDKDTEDDSHENAEYKSDKDVEDESHEDAIKESTDNHIHSNAWLPVDDMGCNESWAEIFTNPSRETDDRVAYKADFNDINNVNPWIDHIGEALYFTTANESIQQLLPEHSNHWNDDGEGDKIGVKRQRKETDVEERSPRRSKLSSSGCTDTTTHM
ncbi:hypothetical protein BDQ17DRAFT_948105 [Cyathus striatus]|nr:hypothetical protein BDQ17DRAFT_948105 [Cyathus striatus]